MRRPHCNGSLNRQCSTSTLVTAAYRCLACNCMVSRPITCQRHQVPLDTLTLRASVGLIGTVEHEIEFSHEVSVGKE